MKISLHIEADSAAEYRQVLAALVIGGIESPLFKQAQVQEPAPAEAVAPLPVEPAVMPEPAPVETVVEAPEPSVKRRPGRPKAMKPVVEEPEEESMPEVKPLPEPVKRTVEEKKPASVHAELANALTHLDVKGAFRDYVIRYGTSNGYNDVPELLTKAFGTEIRKAEHVPNDQSSLKKAIALITQALNDNPYNRKVVNAA